MASEPTVANGPSSEPDALAGINVDLGLLTAFDERAQQENLTMLQAATEGTQAIMNALFKLPMTEFEDGLYVTLPKPSFTLPREKPIPKERPQTKWEKYAQEKGIHKKKKRDRLVLDEVTGDYVPRYGRGSKNSVDRVAVINHKEGMGSDYDPFSAKRADKKKRVALNRKQRLSNIGRAAKKSTLEPMQALSVAKAGPSGKKFLPKKALNDSLAVAQASTASAGKFDKRVQHEPKQKDKGRKKKLLSTVGKSGLQLEKQRLSKVADRVLLPKQ